MKEPEHWELVAQGTSRLKVPGGWLYQVEYRIGTAGSGDLTGRSVVFVPEPKS